MDDSLAFLAVAWLGLAVAIVLCLLEEARR